MKLVLSENNLTDKEMPKLAIILMVCLCWKSPNIFDQNNNVLTELNLSHNNLTFSSARDLAGALTENSTLQKLHLNHNLLKLEAVWRLSSVAIGHKSLRLLNLKGIKLNTPTKNELIEKTKYTMVEILIGGEPIIRSSDVLF